MVADEGVNDHPVEEVLLLHPEALRQQLERRDKEKVQDGLQCHGVEEPEDAPAAPPHAGALALAPAHWFVLLVGVACEQWAFRKLLGVGLTLQQTLELVVLDRPRAILVEGIENVVDFIARRSEAEHGHCPTEFLPGDTAVTIFIPLAKEPNKLSMVLPKGLPER